MRVPALYLLLLLIAPAFYYSQEQRTVSPGEVEAVVTTDLGSFRIEFAPDKAPQHVKQFIALTQEKYYNGSAFFRAVPNGIIQGGDPLLKDPKTPRAKWGTGGLNLLPTEVSDKKHERGTVSAIRIPDKLNSDGSQFFVCLSPQPALDGKYSAFGQVTEGMDVVARISQAPLDKTGLVEKPVRILTITLEPKKMEPFLHATTDELRKTVTMKTTLGTMKIKMEPDWAPEAVRNFLKLTATGWYNGTSFHRLAKGFVLQGGMGNTRSGSQDHPADRWVRTLPAEFRAEVKHVRGIVSMAHADDPNSATTSFFIVLGPASNLDGQYAAFGRVLEGLPVLDAFEKQEVDGETPKQRLEIIEASIDPDSK